MNFNDYSDDIVFGFNTRTGGVSTGVYDSMNLSLTLPDDPEDVMKNYEIWCRDLGVRMQDLVIGLQTTPTTWFGWMSATRGRDFSEPE